jgi:hypothetical protein
MRYGSILPILVGVTNTEDFVVQAGLHFAIIRFVVPFSYCLRFIHQRPRASLIGLKMDYSIAKAYLD